MNFHQSDRLTYVTDHFSYISPKAKLLLQKLRFSTEFTLYIRHTTTYKINVKDVAFDYFFYSMKNPERNKIAEINVIRGLP